MDKVKASQYNYSTEDNYIGDNTSIKDDISKMNLDYEDFTFSLDDYKFDDEIKNKYYSWNYIGMYEFINSNGECVLYLYMFNPILKNETDYNVLYKMTISFFGINYDFYNPKYFLSEEKAYRIALNKLLKDIVRKK